MTQKEQFIAMLDAARVAWRSGNMGADIVVREAAFRFSPSGELARVFSEYGDDE